MKTSKFNIKKTETDSLLERINQRQEELYTLVSNQQTFVSKDVKVGVITLKQRNYKLAAA